MGTPSSFRSWRRRDSLGTTMATARFDTLRSSRGVSGSDDVIASPDLPVKSASSDNATKGKDPTIGAVCSGVNTRLASACLTA